MSARLRRRPLASSLVALALAGAGAAHAAGTSGPRVPPAPAVPDVNALVAQAKEFAAQAREAAKRGGPDATWLALDEGLMSLPPSWAFVGNEFGHSREIIKTREQLNRLYAERTGQPIERITADMERDRFMTPREALDYGLIDQVIEKRP